MVRLIFSNNTGIPAALIRFYTFSKITHCGILLDDYSVLDSDYETKGVSIRSIDDFLKTKKEIVIKEYPRLSPEMITYAKSQLGKPYDLSAIFGLPFHRNWQDDNKWFCAELLLWASKMAGTPILDKEAWRTFPQDILQAI